MSERGRVNPEMLVGISAVVIGVCALGVSLYEAQLMREEQRSAVLPLVELSRSYYTSGENTDRWRLKINIGNVGIGPARVRDFVVRVDGAPHVTWQTAMQALLRRELSIPHGHSTINGRTIPPDTDIVIFDLNAPELASELAAQFDRLELEACYCSVFDECWVASYGELGKDKPVDACRRTTESFAE